MTTDDLLTPNGDEATEEEEPAEGIEDMPPLALNEDGDDSNDDDEVIAEDFTPVEGEEFDPEDPDSYLYATPTVKYSDSAEENEADWLQDDEM